MNIEFKRFTDVKKSAIIELMNNPLVRRQMPLLTDVFNEVAYDNFISSKELLWDKNGYGPMAIMIDGYFAGWGGLQTEDGEVDLALVLHPMYWGFGKILFRMMIEKAFNEMGKASITVLLPPSRTRIKGLLSLGFRRDGKKKVGNKIFLKYRLSTTPKLTN